MSGDLLIRAALLATLRTDGELAAMLNQIADGEPVKASPPWLMVGETQTSAWGARGVEGMTIRQPVLLHLRGDQPATMPALIERIDEVLQTIPTDHGDWRITSLLRDRTRVRRTEMQLRASMDYRIRAARLAGP